MPTDNSTMTPPEEASPSGGKSPGTAGRPAKARRLPRLKQRRLAVDDVNVVDKPMLKKALG
ncbi:hypothetical protein LJD41_26455, partial [Escherichia coli]|nr:hypothetical protein [Escherichia coli]